MSRGYRGAARKRWKRAVWIQGQGRWAVVAYCNHTSVSLHIDRIDAVHSMAFIDRLGCGHQCQRVHALIDMEAGV